MDKKLTPRDEQALAAKTDQAVANDLYRDVERLLTSRLSTWRSKFDQDTIESLQGEAFVRAVRTFEAGRAPFIAFLLSVAYNTLRGHYRDTQRPSHLFRDSMGSLEGIGDLDRAKGRTPAKDMIPGREPDPAESLDHAELRDALEDAICGYAADHTCREFLRDVAFRGKTTYEAADARGLRRTWAIHHLSKFKAFAVDHSGLKEMNANDILDDDDDDDEDLGSGFDD